MICELFSSAWWFEPLMMFNILCGIYVSLKMAFWGLKQIKIMSKQSKQKVK